MSNRYLLWCDLETTGTDESRDDIIEAAFALTDDQDYVIMDSWEEVFKTDLSISQIDPVVLDMHFKNDLWRETIDATRFATYAGDNIAKWVSDMVSDYNLAAKVYLAGSGVSHFDRRFIARNWPQLNSLLEYATFDIGVVRRFLRSWGHEVKFEEPLEHRAMADVLRHIEEAKAYKDWFQGIGRRDQMTSRAAHAPYSFLDDPMRP